MKLRYASYPPVQLSNLIWWDSFRFADHLSRIIGSAAQLSDKLEFTCHESQRHSKENPGFCPASLSRPWVLFSEGVDIDSCFMHNGNTIISPKRKELLVRVPCS